MTKFEAALEGVGEFGDPGLIDLVGEFIARLVSTPLPVETPPFSFSADMTDTPSDEGIFSVARKVSIVELCWLYFKINIFELTSRRNKEPANKERWFWLAMEILYCTVMYDMKEYILQCSEFRIQ